MGQEDVQERELPTGLLLHRELYVGVNTVQVVVERVSKVHQIVREEYGIQALQTVRYYVNSANSKQGKPPSTTHHFSQRCRHYQLMPRSLAVKPLVPTQEG